MTPVIWYIGWNSETGRFGNFDPETWDLLINNRDPALGTPQIWELRFPAGADTIITVKVVEFVLNLMVNLGAELGPKVAFKLFLGPTA